MKGVELYGRVRYAVQIEGLSHRAAARRFGIDPRTVAKMMRFTAPPGYVNLLPDFCSGATGESGRFSEGLLLRRLQPGLFRPGGADSRSDIHGRIVRDLAWDSRRSITPNESLPPRTEREGRLRAALFVCGYPPNVLSIDIVLEINIVSHERHVVLCPKVALSS